MSTGTSAAAFISDGVGRVLLVKHAYGPLNWELPGGAGQAKESVSETVVREVLEETGLTVKVDRLTGVYYDRKSDYHHFLMNCSRVAPTQVPAAADGDEIEDCSWWDVGQLPRPISDFTIRRIADAAERLTFTRMADIAERQYFQ